MPFQLGGSQLLPTTMFNPKAGASSYYDPMTRLRELTQLYGQYPGRAAGGTGSTGLMPSDARGWSNMLEEQQEATRLQAYLGRDEMPTVQQAGDIPSTRTIGQATGGLNPFAFGGANRPAWQGAADIGQGYTTAAEGLKKAGAPADDPRMAEYNRRIRMMR